MYAGDHDVAESDSPLPFIVGREREQTLLRRLLADARDGHGNLVLISGEAGIGKTTLVDELGRVATGQGARVRTGHCYDLSTTPPYGPWIEALGAVGAELQLPATPRLMNGSQLSDGATSQMALFEDLLSYCGTLTEERPLVLTLEDLHWADQASLDLLRFIARQLVPQRFLLVATYRHDEITRDHSLYQILPRLAREARANRIELSPLDDEAIQGWLAQRYVLDDDDRRRLAGYLLERAEGNPFFTAEQLRSLEAEGVLGRSTGSWVLSKHLPVQVPALIRQVVDSRLVELDDNARTALEVAAVIGQDVPYDLWLALAGIAEPELARCIEHALEAHFLVEAPDRTGFRFTHALVREALYELLLLPYRRRLHQRVASILIEAPQPDPDIVAHHLQQAADERAAQWLIQAGKRALAGHAYSTAMTRFENALALESGAVQDPAQRAEVLLQLGRLRRIRDPHQAINDLTEAVRLAVQAGDAVLAAVARFRLGHVRRYAGHLRWGLADQAQGLSTLETLTANEVARVTALDPIAAVGLHHASFAFGLANAGHYDEALQEIARAEAECQFGHVTDLPTTLGLIHASRGRPDLARSAFARAREAAKAVSDHEAIILLIEAELLFVILPYYSDHLTQWRGEAVEAWARAHQVLGDDLPQHMAFLSLLVHEGRWAEARSLALEARDDVHSNYLLLGRRVLAPLAFRQGDLELAHALMEQELPGGQDADPGSNDYLMALGAQRLGAALALDSGNLAAARKWLEAHDRWLAWNDTVLGRVEGQVLWAQYCQAAGERAGARRHAEQALAAATNPRQPLALLAAERFLGELDTAAGQFDAANEHLQAALSLAERCEAPYERATTLLALAEMQTKAGQRPEALLDEARAILTRLGAAPALARADALAEQLSKLAQPTRPAGLTPREVEVLRLLASGKSNREVASELYMSVRTAERHITNVYTKINVHNRAEAIAFAHREGLVGG